MNLNQIFYPWPSVCWLWHDHLSNLSKVWSNAMCFANRYLYFLIFVSLSIAAPALSANSFWQNWQASVALGYGERSNPLLGGDDITTVINLDMAWYGERFFFENGDMGLNLWATDRVSLDLVGQLNNERIFFAKAEHKGIRLGEVTGADLQGDAENISDETTVEAVELPDRDHAYEAGLALSLHLGRDQWQLAVLEDISGRHHGWRVDLAYGRHYIQGRWLIQPALTLSWKSRRLIDYYYGVAADEETSQFSRYRAGSGYNLSAAARFSYVLRKHLFWQTVLEYEHLAETIDASPLTAEGQVSTLYTGLQYRF